MLKKILFLTTLPTLLLADDCSGYLSCDECAAARCGWCINTRRCVPDVAWQCQGEVDHIGALTGKQCPKQHELAAMRLLGEEVMPAFR